MHTHTHRHTQCSASMAVACSYDLWTTVPLFACFLFSPRSSCQFRTAGDANAACVEHCRMRVCLFCSLVAVDSTHTHTHTETEPAVGQQAASSQRRLSAGISISRSCVSGCLSNTGVLPPTLTSAHLHRISVNSQRRGSEHVGALVLRGLKTRARAVT